MTTPPLEDLASQLSMIERGDLLELCYRARPRATSSMERMEHAGLVEFLDETRSGTTWFRATALGRKVRAFLLRTKENPMMTNGWTADDYYQGRLFVDHGVLDEKGRRVGGEARIYFDPTSALYQLTIHAMRSGTCYGAYPRHTTYLSLDAAKTAAAKGLETQRKRYTHKYGRRV